MGRNPRVNRTYEERWQFVQEGIKSVDISETRGVLTSRRSMAKNIPAR